MRPLSIPALQTGGVSRMWEQLLRTGPGIELPMYGGSVQHPPQG